MSSNLTAKEAEPGSGVQFDHPAEQGFEIRVIDKQKAIVESTPRRKKVAIVGFATSSRELAPFDDPDYEIWTLNQLYRHVPRSSRHFDIHLEWEKDNVEGTDHRGWIKECGVPCYMVNADPDLPTSVRYPIEDVLKMAGLDYFTSTIAFEVGLAMLLEFEEIALYGIDLIVGSEYSEQKACLEFWLGMAHAKGITVRIPPQSALLTQSHRYGYQQQPNWGPLQMKEVHGRIEHLTTERTKQMALINAIDGALAEDERWFIRKMNEQSPEDRMKQLQEQRNSALATLATLDGAAQESTYWRDLYTLRGRGAAVNGMI
jgi:hypothetical protein